MSIVCFLNLRELKITIQTNIQMLMDETDMPAKRIVGAADRLDAGNN